MIRGGHNDSAASSLMCIVVIYTACALAVARLAGRVLESPYFQLSVQNMQQTSAWSYV